MEMDRLIGTQEAADLLGVGRARLIQLIHKGVIPARKWGRDWTLDPRDLERADWPGRKAFPKPKPEGRPPLPPPRPRE
jgi:excisionase family DNA binding protein